MKLFSLKKSYGDKVALDLSDIEFSAGQITAVLGESGAGKSTLLSCIAESIPHEGKVEGAGKVSYLFQKPHLLPNLTVEGNLRFVLEKGEWSRIFDMLSRVGLSEKACSRPYELSGGERQRVAIARAFLFPHDTLLMDEPFSSLDLSLKRSLMELTREMCEEKGETVIFVTHDVREAVFLARRAVVLKRGKLIADLPVEGERDFFRPHPAEEALVRALTAEECDKFSS